jgi:predicted unusual protein kinase regulating ubiquinone biosynthesis (AarF/ABC1/UbiB family)
MPLKEQDNISTSRLGRTGKFLKTGAKLGGNYLKYYSKRMVSDSETANAQLQEDNANDIYNTLSELKGSALKVAQMMSLDQGMLPQAYTDKFSQAQYSAPPLSYPLVIKTFRTSLGKGPSELFDHFDKHATAAASIGQVHKAEKAGNVLAVKVQYPGVADSISSDLKIVRPIVGAMFNISSSEMDHYLQEVEVRLLEETDYELELQRSKEITAACASIQGLLFPHYYDELSGERVLTMDWMPGKHLDAYLKTNPSQDARNKVGQILWDFYDHQIHQMLQVHADPHPGNFLFQEDGRLGVIDFGCVKQFSAAFHHTYFQLMNPEVFKDKVKFTELLYKLDFLLQADSEAEVNHFTTIYSEVLELLGRPFFSKTFDFADEAYFAKIYALSDIYSKDKMLRKAKAARGPRDAIYLNRTYFGLYSILNKLGAKISTHSALSIKM